MPLTIITRNINEGVRIGIAHVRVTSVDGKQVRLSILAPPEMLILRDELAADGGDEEGTRSND